MTPKRKEHRKKCQKKHLILCFFVIWEAINANAVPEWKCRRLANAGGGQCYHLSALWCSPSGVSNWYNVNKQVNDSRDMHKKTMLTRSAVSNCQRDFFFLFVKVEVVPCVTFECVGTWPQLFCSVLWFALKRHSSFWRQEQAAWASTVKVSNMNLVFPAANGPRATLWL